MTNKHSFHIPVMGIGFTVDTPLKVAQYGIDSVIALSDDQLLEKLRKMYYAKYNLPYQEITSKIKDFRAKRITSYLNLMHDLVDKKFKEVKDLATGKTSELKKYFDMLPDSAEMKREFKNFFAGSFNQTELGDWLRKNLFTGSIDVNIMTKVDKANFANGEQLPLEFNDAHAALRGYAQSNLSSSLILSAGMSPRLYAYLAEFDDFYNDQNGYIKKKIVLKVSDYRSALIQGKFLAKKGLWVSEYRVESGLNCGGHAFATQGHLLGPILAEFRDNRQELSNAINEILVVALEAKGRPVPKTEMPIKITAQGGVGTAEEHDFLLDHYQIDSVGWGSPFLLVPEVTNVDKKTLNQLSQATEKDLYLSNVSPLGVPFNNLKGNSKDLEKSRFMEKNRPGSSCPKKFLSYNTEFTDKPICTASRQYQDLKIKELNKAELSPEVYKKEYEKVTEKSCICVGLGTAALLTNNLNTKVEGEGVSVCPGPNMAYFSKTVSLSEMVNHILGKSNVLIRKDRPNMFVKELNIYIKYLADEMENAKTSISGKKKKYLERFAENLKQGIDYYSSLFKDAKNRFETSKATIVQDLELSSDSLEFLKLEIEKL